MFEQICYYSCEGAAGVFSLIRYGTNVYHLKSSRFADALPALRACGGVVADGCAKVQCMARSSGADDGLRARRALDDCMALRHVVRHCADVFGVNSCQLLRPFVCELDVCATLANRCFVARWCTSRMRRPMGVSKRYSYESLGENDDSSKKSENP